MKAINEKSNESETAIEIIVPNAIVSWYADYLDKCLEYICSNMAIIRGIKPKNENANYTRIGQLKKELNIK